MDFERAALAFSQIFAVPAPAAWTVDYASVCPLCVLG